MSQPPVGTVTLKEWNATALWKWDLDADTCSICRNIVMMPCIDCTSKSSINCSISWGACTHAFHTHCLDRWLKVRNACPIDNQPWVLKRVSSANNG